MDATDLKILAILQEDSSVSVGEIAGRVGLWTMVARKRRYYCLAVRVIRRIYSFVFYASVAANDLKILAILQQDSSE